MFMKQFLLVLFSTLFLAMPSVVAQVFSEEDARSELEKRGISEDELIAKLLEKGIDINEIDRNNPSEIIEFERAAQKAIEEIELERQYTASTQDTVPNNTIGDITSDLLGLEMDSLIQQDSLIDEIDTLEFTLPPAKVYGHQFFRNGGVKLFKQSDYVKPGANYILDSGDKLNISIFGKSQENLNFTIGQDGFISPNKMPRIFLKGLSLSQAKKLIESRFEQFYNFKSGEFEVNIADSRTITVTIYGEVFYPGSYTISATNTAFNALVAAGGPTDIGTVRNIEISRTGSPTKVLDIYNYLTDPRSHGDFFLQDNDYIFVPVSGNVVSVDGAVKRPYKYELKNDEGLKNTIDYAGGFAKGAFKSDLKIFRSDDDKEKLLEVDYRILNSYYPMLNGDSLYVRTIPSSYRNFVHVSGAVEFPGDYQLTSNTTISDVIRKAELRYEARTDYAILYRMKKDNSRAGIPIKLESAINNPVGKENLQLQPQDSLVVYSESKFSDNSYFAIEGAVREPGRYYVSPDESVKVFDAVTMAGGIKDNATEFAYIYRKNSNTVNNLEYIRVNLVDIMSNPGINTNILIEPFDSIAILEQDVFIDTATIEIEGAVRSPGTYIYDKSLSLKDIITLAGGLKLEASKSKIDVFRLNFFEENKTNTSVLTYSVDEKLNIVGENQFVSLRPFDKIVVRNAPEFEFQKIVMIEGEVRYPGPYPITDDNERIYSLINRAGSTTIEAFPAGATLYRKQNGVGFVVLKLDEVLDNPESIHNLVLKDGDIINIPKTNDLVTIIGFTNLKELYPEKIFSEGKVNVPFQKGKTAKFYIDKYGGGVSKDGARRLISVEHPNGEIEKAKNYYVFLDYPKIREGSIIKVGRRPLKENQKPDAEKEPIDWGKVFTDTFAQATAVLSLILLIQRLD